jgi:CheY-like chemotaxis protein
VSDERVTVFLLDDHEVVRRGLRELLESEGIEVVGEAGTAAEAFGRIRALDPDVAVLDVRIPDGDGVSVCRDMRSRHPRTTCLILTSFADDEALFEAIMAGARGARHASLARFLALCELEPLTDVQAKAVGVVAGRAHHGDIVDVTVVEGAIRRRDAVVTSHQHPHRNDRQSGTSRARHRTRLTGGPTAVCRRVRDVVPATPPAPRCADRHGCKPAPATTFRRAIPAGPAT